MFCVKSFFCMCECIFLWLWGVGILELVYKFIFFFNMFLNNRLLKYVCVLNDLIFDIL